MRTRKPMLRAEFSHQQAPAMLLVASEVVLDALEHALHPRYTPQYRLLRAGSREQALALLRQLEHEGELLALCICHLELPGADGPSLLATARAAFPSARCVLMTPSASSAAAVESTNVVGIDGYVLERWGEASDRLYPLLDDLLDDWMNASRVPYLRVRSVMETRIARIEDGASLHHAAEIVALSGVGDLMVVDRERRFVGVLSEGDILRNALPDLEQILEAGGTLYEAYQLFLRKGQELAKRPIAPLVIRDPIVMHPDDHVAKAAVVMIQRQIRRLPVIEEGRLVGTVSRACICQAVVGTF